nr:MAG TPA: hypothetical protein [Caudoviricetes sp.]
MKSEKAKKYLFENGLGYPYTGYVTEQAAERAVELAEQEAEERMRKKAISAFDDMWFENGEFEPDYEYHRRNFIQKLNEA